jgi:hypothetical protein
MIIWPVALLVVLAWPPASGSSLAAKAIPRLADPFDTLPDIPQPLPIGLDDDGDAVSQHDARERSYYDARDRSTLNRLRMGLKGAADPFEASTQRQMLVALVVVAALVVWRLESKAEN